MTEQAADMDRGLIRIPRTPVADETLGPYRILRPIGHGGMSIVYEATHLPLDRTVALKLLLPSLAGDREFVERFLVEARAAARLDAPHIVPVYDCGEIDGLNYIAMKLLEGRDLRRILQEQRAAGAEGLPLDRVVSIASQAATALEYAHRHRVIHRDVKPANIYVDASDGVTLVDFGIARALDSVSTTQTGSVLGTPAYMSPEQAQGKPVDYRSDIYSLGIVVFEMLCGSPPFSGSPQTAMYGHIYTAPPLSQLRADLPHGVVEALERALAKDPDDRFQSASAFALALANAAGVALEPQSLHALGEPDADATYALSLPAVSGPVSAVPVMASSIGAVAPAAAIAPSVPRKRRLPAPPVVAFGSIGIVAALALFWAFVAGPLGPTEGQLIVTSDPQGATVTVDGNRLGVTPLPAWKLPPGPHQVVLDKPAYAAVQRSETIRRGARDVVNASLTPLPAFDLLTVKQAIVARGIQENNGAISFTELVSSVAVEQPFGMIVTVGQKQPGGRDVSFQYEIALQDAAGNQLRSSTPATATIAANDTAGKSFAFSFTFHALPDGTVAAGSYQLVFLIDGKVVTSRQVTLTQ